MFSLSVFYLSKDAKSIWLLLGFCRGTSEVFHEYRWCLALIIDIPHPSTCVCVGEVCVCVRHSEVWMQSNLWGGCNWISAGKPEKNRIVFPRDFPWYPDSSEKSSASTGLYHMIVLCGSQVKVWALLYWIIIYSSWKKLPTGDLLFSFYSNLWS